MTANARVPKVLWQTRVIDIWQIADAGDQELLRLAHGIRNWYLAAWCQRQRWTVTASLYYTC